MRARYKEQYARALERRRRPKIIHHGTLGGYGSGCRCMTCRQANAMYSRWYRNESM